MGVRSQAAGAVPHRRSEALTIHTPSVSAVGSSELSTPYLLTVLQPSEKSICSGPPSGEKHALRVQLYQACVAL